MRTVFVAASLVALATCSVYGQGSTLTQSQSKAVEFTGTEVLTLLGITAFKSEVRFTRPQQMTKVAMVIGRVEKGIISERETVFSNIQGMPPESRCTVGLVVLPDSGRLVLMHGGLTLNQGIPEGFNLEYKAFARDGIYDSGTVIFAYDPRDASKRPKTKADCTRYLGIKIYLKD